jgi:hypothetical protein
MRGEKIGVWRVREGPGVKRLEMSQEAKIPRDLVAKMVGLYKEEKVGDREFRG